MARSLLARLAWPLAFAACALGSGFAALAMGQDANWDLRNYHFYNAYAAVEGRLGFDWAPAQLQSFHNPTLDLPFWFLVQWLPGPRSVAFTWAALTAGVAAFFFLRLLFIVFPRSTPQRLLLVGAAGILGLTTATGIAELGSTMNDWPSTALVMAALAVALRPLARGDAATGTATFLAGILLGAATGLKLTNAPYCIGLVAALLATGGWRDGVRRGQASMLGMGVGFVLAYGWWGALMQSQFASPFFPFFNEFFRSAWWEPVNWFDRKFGPRAAWQALVYPLWMTREYPLVSEISFRDYRLGVAYLLGLALLAAVMVTGRGRIRRARLGDGDEVRTWMFLGAFAVVSFAAWLVTFSIHRYLLPLEVLSGALIVGLLARLVRNPVARRVAIVLLTALIVSGTRKAGWERVPFGERYFEVAVPATGRDALVIMGFNAPASYLIPFFPAGARFVSPYNNFLAIEQRNLLARRIAQAIESHRGGLYLLEEREPPALNDVTLQRFRLARGECEVIRSNIDRDALRLCALLRG